MAEISDLTLEIRRFAEERDWIQFHTVRNLVLAISGEVGELAAELQWISDAEVNHSLADPKVKSAVEEELADVAIYLFRLADVIGVDIGASVLRKLQINEVRYPAELARGNSRKYTELQDS